ncbi:zinc finger protein DZIP1 isoform X2 [Harmonia axyridis]|nr:zinc finger protein DZIP1 isoform X2 [Harmonia axyridis]
MWLNNYEWHLDYIRLAKDSSFSFERTKFPLDKNKICLLDVDKVIEEKDVAIIEQLLPSLVQYNIDTNEHIGIIDQNFLKMFRMSQLAVEYLLFCKKYLDHSVILIKEEIKDIKMENEELRIFNNELKKHTDTLLAKLKKRELATTFKCNKCLKAFSTEEYLTAHIDRRHTNKNNESFELGIETEIKEIKEKLNNTEKLIKNEELNPKLEDTLNKNYSKVSELLLKFESLRSQVENDFKMLHNQKDFEEKYLKVFQSALENVKTQINNELSLQSSPYRFHDKRNSITQTDLDEINTSEKIVQADEISETMERTGKTQLYEQKFEKLEVQMKSACENISNTMGSSLKNIEIQMQALWDKLQGLESKKLTQDLPDVNETKDSQVEKELRKPTPKLRKRPSRSISNKSSEQMLMPKEIKSERPSSDTRHNILDDIEDKEIPIDLNEVTMVKSSKSLSKPDTKLDDLDRIDVLDEIEPSTTITVVKSINSLYETEDLESEEEDPVRSSEVNSESERSPDEGSNNEYPSKVTVLHKEKSGSTLGKRSISSLRRASLSSEVIERLKKEMRKVLMERLNMLGVSNEWKGIPEQTYSRVMDILNHQAKLVEKSVPNYKNIRSELLMKAEQEFCSKGSLKSVENQTKIKKTKVKGTFSPRSWSNKNGSFRIRKHQSAPQVEIRNRKMYESDSSSEEENKKKNLKKTASTIVQYSAVIEELRQTQRSEENLLDHKSKTNISLPDNNLDLQMKGVLKNFPTAGPVPKKRVLFDLKSQDSEIQKPITRDVGGGSTTSVASSVLDLSDESSPIIEDEKKPETVLDIKDFSDSDFSILNSGKIIQK